MNTAEAIAACLYIAGFKDLARVLLDPFGWDYIHALIAHSSRLLLMSFSCDENALYAIVYYATKIVHIC